MVAAAPDARRRRVRRRRPSARTLARRFGRRPQARRRVTATSGRRCRRPRLHHRSPLRADRLAERAATRAAPDAVGLGLQHTSEASPQTDETCRLNSGRSMEANKTRSSRVEGRRVTGRARWLIRRFRTGPQSEAHRHVSSPRSPNPACRFPAPGSPVESCGSHTGFPGATSGRVSRSRGTRLAPLRRSTGWVVRPVDALTTATARAVPFAYACDDVRHCCSSPG